jgi:hypothetical protein
MWPLFERLVRVDLALPYVSNEGPVWAYAETVAPIDHRHFPKFPKGRE